MTHALHFRSGLIALALAAIACKGDKEDTGAPAPADDTGLPGCQDDDSDCDGWADEDDCAPDDPYTYPGADEIPYDGKDNDCAGDGDLTDWDGDGYDSDYVGGDDCNDGNPEVYPGAPEVCYNDRDENCDGEPAEGEAESWDCDGDGYDGRGKDATDCDDENAAIYPGAAETWYDGVDQDCSSTASSDYDADGDGDDSEDYGGSDCDDSDPLTAGTLPELWDGVDRDCDGTVDSLTTYDATQAFYANSLSGDIYFGWTLFRGDDYDGDGTLDLGGCGPFSGEDDKDYNGWCHILPMDGETDGTPPDHAFATIAGDARTYLGFNAENLGDLDGDGWSEIAIGEVLYDGDGGTLVFDGAKLAGGGSLGESAAIAVLTGNTYVGFDVAVLGDLDGDGLPEVAAGSGDYMITGGSNLWLGIFGGAAILDGGELGQSDALSSVSGSSVGGETVGGGDFDGDGIPDLAGARGVDGRGSAFLVSGAELLSGDVLDPESYQHLLGGSSEDQAGLHLAVLQDADGDGLSDLVVSAPGATVTLAQEGAVYVISGDAAWTSATASAAAMFTIQGVEPYGRLAVSGEAGADFDADGTDDLVVAEMGGHPKAVIRGTVHAISGTLVAGGGTVQTDEEFGLFPSRFDGDWYGWSGLAWDIEGDGDADLALGAPMNNDVGMVQIFRSGWADE